MHVCGSGSMCALAYVDECARLGVSIGVSDRMNMCVCLWFVRVCLCMCVYLGACADCDLQRVCMCVHVGLSGKSLGPGASGFLLDLEVVISPPAPHSPCQCYI